ncbi:MAG: CvpA family protein [Eubacteriaceae bacterium]
MNTMVLFFVNLLPLIIALSYAMSGWRKGAVWEILNIVRFFLSYYLARAFSGSFASWIQSWPAVSSWVQNLADTTASDITQKSYSLISSDTTAAAVNTGVHYVLTGISFIIIMIIISFLIGRVMHMTNVINKVPVLGTVNRSIGSIGGFLYGILIALIIYTLLLWCSSLFGWTDVNLYLSQSWYNEMIVRFGGTYGF